jgi:hypothetical protein
MIWLAFCAMVIMIAPALKWSWWYVALVIVTGPIGALLVWWRLRSEGVPDVSSGPGATATGAPPPAR